MRLNFFMNRLKLRQVLECASPLGLWLCRSWKIVRVLILFAAPPQPAFAQAPDPGSTMIQLMMTQPPTDISSPVVATASFDPPRVRPGEKSIYRVTFNATEVSIQWPGEISAPPQLKLRRTASGQIMQQTGGMMRPLTTFNYDVRASESGRFTIPEFVVDVYGKPVVVSAAQIEVQTELPPSHETARQLLIETSATNLFVGESLTIRVLLPANAANSVEGLSQVELNGDGFIVDKNSVRQSIQTIERNGRRQGAYIYEVSLTPIAGGELKLFAQGFTAGMQFGGPIVITGQVTIPGGPPKYVLLDSEFVNLHIRPLPAEGELPGFAGAVGSYVCDLPQLATNTVQAGDPVQLRVTVRGQQNLNRLAPPLPPRVPGWQIFPAIRTGIVGEAGTPTYGATFSYTLIPTTDELRATPAIPFSCFDPRRAAYVDLTVQPVAITVISNGMVGNAETPVLLAESAFEPEIKLALSKLAPSPGRTTGSLVPLQLRGWFPLVLLTPVLGFCALGFWDRRRRFLERHPEIARRRQARRELRRVKRLLKQAAASGDAAGFRQSAVKAMQIAAAPHYPAEPEALVGGDVLEILDMKERVGRAGEVVRRIFAEADAAAFATTSPGQDELLGWQSEFDAVLVKLEERL